MADKPDELKSPAPEGSIAHWPHPKDDQALALTHLWRELAAVKELALVQLHSAERTIHARLDAIDKATTLFEENLTRVPTDVDKAISHLKELVNQKFAGVDNQLRERDEQVKERAAEVKDQIASAFSAAEKLGENQTESFEKSTQKSEDSFTKQLTSLDNKIGVLMDQMKEVASRPEMSRLYQTLADKIDGPTGVALQLRGLESRISAREEQKASGTGNVQWGIIAALTGLAILISLISLFRDRF